LEITYRLFNKITDFNLLHVEKIITHCKGKSVTYGLLIQKRVIRVMLRLGPWSSCSEGFKKLDILTIPCLYIYALMLFAVKNLAFIKKTSLLMV
jgi:hypothetical protein